MSVRTEFEKPIRLGRDEGKIFVSAGRSDDYLELTLPAGVSRDSTELKKLRTLAIAGGVEVGMEFHEGSPDLVSITALYIDAPGRRELPVSERVAAILLDLARVAPALDFGDLLPDRPAEEVLAAEAEPAPTAMPIAVSSQEIPPSIMGEAADTAPISLADLSRSGNLARARAFASRGQTHKATRLLGDILREAPSNQEARDLHEIIRQAERREKRAKREHRNPQAHLEAGFSYLALERNSEAARSLEQASRLDPELYLAHILLGIAHHREGKVVAARNAYNRAGRLRPSDQIHRDLLLALERGDPPAGLAESSSGHSPSASHARRQALAWSN